MTTYEAKYVSVEACNCEWECAKNKSAPFSIGEKKTKFDMREFITAMRILRHSWY